MVSSFVMAASLFAAGRAGMGVEAHTALIINVVVTTTVWVAVAYLTPATDRATLVAFYRLVRPAGPGWESVRREAGVGPSPDSLAQSLLGWTAGCLFVYAALFGTGAWLYGNALLAGTWGIAAVGAAIVVGKVLRR